MPAEIWLPAAALAVEACVGYPQALYARIAHPVVWIGKLIEALERRWNDPARSDAARRTLGIVTMIDRRRQRRRCRLRDPERRAAVAVRNASSWCWSRPSGLAQRSLYTHVRDVLRPLARGDLPAARDAVSKIVGRDTAQLTPSGVAAAAIESLAESFNDGIVAPAFWLAVGGLPGLFAYKALNTADSLIGHREPRWRAFGWAAARADDLANLIPARLAGLLIVARRRRRIARDVARRASPRIAERRLARGRDGGRARRRARRRGDL